MVANLNLYNRKFRFAVALFVITLALVALWAIGNLNVTRVHADTSLASVADRISQLLAQGTDVEIAFHTPIGSDKVPLITVSQKNTANTFAWVSYGSDYVCFVANSDPKTAQFCVPDSNIAYFDFHGTPAGTATAVPTK